jgi:hypothetical protein
VEITRPGLFVETFEKGVIREKEREEQKLREKNRDE